MPFLKLVPRTERSTLEVVRVEERVVQYYYQFLYSGQLVKFRHNLSVAFSKFTILVNCDF